MGKRPQVDDPFRRKVRADHLLAAEEGGQRRQKRWIDSPTTIEAATVLRRSIVVIMWDEERKKWSNNNTVNPREAKKKALVIAFKGKRCVAANLRAGTKNPKASDTAAKLAEPPRAARKKEGEAMGWLSTRATRHLDESTRAPAPARGRPTTSAG